MSHDDHPDEEEDSSILEDIADLSEGALSKGAEIIGTAAGLAVAGPVGAVVGGVAGKKAVSKLIGDDGPFITDEGPSAVGAYPHLYKSGDLLFVSGMGPRTPDTNEIPGGPVRDEDGNPQTVFTILRNGRQTDFNIKPALITINPASGDKVRQIGIQPSTHIVSQLVENSPAHKGGLQLDDRIVSVNGILVYSIPAIREHLKKQGGQPTTLGIERKGNPMELQIHPQLNAEKKSTVTLQIPDGENALTLHFLPDYAEKPTQVPSPETPAELILFNIEGNTGKMASSPKIGDTLQELAGKPVKSIQAVQASFVQPATKPQILTLKSGDDIRNLKLPESTEILVQPVSVQPLLGFVMGGETRIHLDPLTQVRRHVNTTFQVLGSLLNRNSDIGVRQLSGPIGIGRVFHRFANVDFRLVLVFAVLLNINLAILNMLPIPVLDGGHILFATIAKLRKNKVPISLIVRIQTVFVLLLFSMIIYVGVYDSLRWKGDNDEERRYEILRSLYFDPPIVTEPISPASPKPTPDGTTNK